MTSRETDTPATRPTRVPDAARDGSGPDTDATTRTVPPGDTAPDTTARRGRGVSPWLGSGALAGLLAGAAFMALNAWFAAGNGLHPLAPFRTVATLVEGPPPVEATVGVGIVVHAVLSVLFGVVFAALLVPLRRRSAGWIAWAGLVFGGVVYLVDFQLLARGVAYFSAFRETNQPLELAAHLVFGAVLAALLLLAKPRTAQRR